jgi:hypothetical protein
VESNENDQCFFLTIKIKKIARNLEKCGGIYTKMFIFLFKFAKDWENFTKISLSQNWKKKKTTI